MRRVTKGYSGKETPLFATMLEVEIPQSNFPTQTPVADEAAFTCVDVVHGGAATTISSIDTGQGSGNITKYPTMPHDSPLLGGHTPGSDKGSMTLHELTVLCTNLSNKVESLETELKQTKQTYCAAFTKLIKKVKKLEQTVKTSQARRRAKIMVTDDEDNEEDSSKQGRSMIEVSDQLEDQLGVFSAAKVLADATKKRREVVNVHSYTRIRKAISTGSGGISTARGLFSTAEESVSTGGASMPVSTTKQEELHASETDEEVAQKQEEFDAANDKEWLKVGADEDLVQQLQEGKKYSEEDLPIKLVELVNQRKKFFAQQRAEAKRNKPMNPA
ncbi:hypothetical protein Tco_1014952 [Tanacetum coccineum]